MSNASPCSLPRVLVVDDDQDNVDSLAVLIGLWGYQVFKALDGPSALDATSAHCPDVVLLDIGMPGLDGREVARRLKTMDGRPPFIIAMSGYAQQEEQMRALRAGCDHYLVKPADLDGLKTLLGRLACRQTEALSAS
jgi:CheY-like chemotaxis protein